VEPRSHLQQAGRTATKMDTSFGWLRNPTQNLQERGFPGAVAPDDADDLALLDRQVNVAKRPELLLVGSRPVFRTTEPAPRTPKRALHHVSKAVALRALVRDDVAFRELLERNDRVAHWRIVLTLSLDNVGECPFCMTEVLDAGHK